MMVRGIPFELLLFSLTLLGVVSQSHGEALAARGLHRLAHARGLPI